MNSVIQDNLAQDLADSVKDSKPQNAAGITMNGVIKYNIDDFHVTKGLLCSSNVGEPKEIKVDKNSDGGEVELKCEEKLRGKEILNADEDSVLNVKCPKSCDAINTPVYGTMIYHDESSLCRAAIHAGAIKSY